MHFAGAADGIPTLAPSSMFGMQMLAQHNLPMARSGVPEYGSRAFDGGGRVAAGAGPGGHELGLGPGSGMHDDSPASGSHQRALHPGGLGLGHHCGPSPGVQRPLQNPSNPSTGFRDHDAPAAPDRSPSDLLRRMLNIGGGDATRAAGYPSPSLPESLDMSPGDLGTFRDTPPGHAAVPHPAQPGRPWGPWGPTPWPPGQHAPDQAPRPQWGPIAQLPPLNQAAHASIGGQGLGHGQLPVMHDPSQAWNAPVHGRLYEGGPFGHGQPPAGNSPPPAWNVPDWAPGHPAPNKASGSSHTRADGSMFGAAFQPQQPDEHRSRPESISQPDEHRSRPDAHRPPGFPTSSAPGGGPAGGSVGGGSRAALASCPDPASRPSASADSGPEGAESGARTDAAASRRGEEGDALQGVKEAQGRVGDNPGAEGPGGVSPPRRALAREEPRVAVAVSAAAQGRNGSSRTADATRERAGNPNSYPGKGAAGHARGASPDGAGRSRGHAVTNPSTGSREHARGASPDGAARGSARSRRRRGGLRAGEGPTATAAGGKF